MFNDLNRENKINIENELKGRTFSFNSVKKYYSVSSSNILFVSEAKQNSKGYIIYNLKNEDYGFRIDFSVIDKDLLSIEYVKFGLVNETKNINVYKKETISFGNSTYEFVEIAIGKEKEKKIVGSLSSFLSTINIEFFPLFRKSE